MRASAFGQGEKRRFIEDGDALLPRLFYLGTGGFPCDNVVCCLRD
jgi:hypothetical protein